MRESWYDTAQICLNGHVINSMAASSPSRNSAFCEECGAPTIMTCPGCSASIRGYYHVPGVIGAFGYSPPSFCHNCGKPYPWVEAKLKAAQELAQELDNLSPDEREILKKSLDDLVRDTPQTTVAATRFKRLVAKAGRGAAEGMRTILVDILSEAAKRTLWG